MKWGWIAFAAVLAAFLALRRRRLEPTLLVGGAIVAIGSLVYGLGAFHPPNVEHILRQVGSTLGPWTYLLVGVFAFLETGAFVGLVAPGETAILVGGLVAGQGHISIVVLIALVWICAVGGDMASFLLGRRLGRQFLVRHGPKVSITEERLEKVEAFFDRHGGKAIFLGRFVGLVRAIAPFLAGSSHMPLRRFAPYDIVGAGLWGSVYCLLGYAFWQSFDQLLSYAGKGATAVGVTIVVIAAIAWLVRHLRDEQWRARVGERLQREAQRPALRPLARVLTPVARRGQAPARFVWDRVTPGDLGLEVTTLLAIAAVGVYGFVSLTIGVSEDRYVPGDLALLRTGNDVRSSALNHVAEVLTWLGALPAAGGVLLVTAAVLIWRGRRLEAVTLAASLILVVSAVTLTKHLVDRPRPLEPIVHTAGQSFPSGHSAYAVFWVAVAIALRRMLPGIAGTAVAVTAAIVLVVVIAATRIYLRAHFLSDVAAGAGLSAAILSLCGVAVLVVDHVRHNGART
ncbi:MAG TPA: bifunctional DedA family/phosphatase PAP2 family protein [Solirubrobacteraceae bacterium]|nr:bifunctional DedA family/phosphatase PAP2 family protein [Solirubrobacteraceae bacterium]